MIKRIIRYDGYVLLKIPGYPNSVNGYILEHRYVMEQHLGRSLRSDEIVHHKDKNKQNNSLDNLELTTNSEHNRLHGLQQGRLYVKLKCPECGKEFDIPKNQSYLQKSNKYNCTCCSRSCKGKFYRKIKLNGLSDDIIKSIDECLIEEYKKYNNI